MTWAVVTTSLVVLSLAFLVATIAQIQDAHDDDRYFRLSIRFWTTLAALGLALLVAFVPPVMDLRWLPHGAAEVTTVLASIPALVVVFGGLWNAVHLVGARDRRRDALTCPDETEARVIARDRRLFGHDILSVTVEASVPSPAPGRDLAYRWRESEPVERRRFVETCPGDQWGRLEPGARVRLRYDPRDPRRYAVVLFD